MGLFSKDEKIPSIPKAPALPELPQPEGVRGKDLPELPTFPMGSKNENLNQEMVKSAVAEIPSLGEEEVSVDIPSGIHVREDSDLPRLPPMKRETRELPPIPTIPRMVDQPRISMPTNPTPISPKPSINEPIFIRLDKFQTSQKNLETIKEKIAKVEVVLKKIEDTKAKEEAELKAWMEDINQVKAKIAEIDQDIFDQI